MKTLQLSKTVVPLAATSRVTSKDDVRDTSPGRKLSMPNSPSEQPASLLSSDSSFGNPQNARTFKSNDSSSEPISTLAHSQSPETENNISSIFPPYPPPKPLHSLTKASVLLRDASRLSLVEDSGNTVSLGDSHLNNGSVSIPAQSVKEAGVLDTAQFSRVHGSLQTSLSDDINVSHAATIGPPHLRDRKPSNSPKLSGHSRRKSDGLPWEPDEISPLTKTVPVQRRTLFGFGRHLMGMDYNLEMSPDSTVIEDAWSVATKRRGVYNLFQVPTRIERLLAFGQLICWDEFLSVFTFLPLRVLLALLKLLLFIICCPGKLLLTNRSRKLPDMDSVRNTEARVGHIIDILHVSLLAFTVMALRMFDISWIYHNIRGQSVIKLYVVFNAMEIFDRLCSSFGVDILDSLGWTTASAVRFFSRVSPPTGELSENSLDINRARALQGAALLTRMTFDYLCALIYVVLHSSLLLTWVVTLNVAINTQNNALLTLLVSNNFVELKGSVFKTVKIQNLFQISCADAVERFQLTVFLGVMLAVTTADQHLFTTWIVIYSCEIFVDWIKHAFVTKFNRISPRMYRQFSLVICDDMAKTRKHSVVRSIGGSAISKRIGFVSLPLAALTIRMLIPPASSLPVPALCMLFVTLTMFKLALGIVLTGHAHRKVKRAALESPVDLKDELGKDHDMYWRQKLFSVERYDLITKN